MRPASNSAAPRAGSNAPRWVGSERTSARSSCALAVAGSAARLRGLGRGLQVLDGAGGEHSLTLAAALQLGREPAGPFEVVRDHLVRRPPAGEPVRDRRVHLGAHALRHAGVRHLADQRVVEAKRLLAGELRLVGRDQPAPHERDEAPADRRTEQRRQRPRVEPAPLDRRALEQQPSLGLEPVDPRREHRLNAHRQVALVLPRANGHELLHEQRVPLGAVRDPRGLRARAEALGEVTRMRDVERLEFEHRAVALRRGPCRARLEQLGTREADDQDRGSAGQRGNVVDQVEQRRLGPVNVLDDQDQWTVDGEPLEQPAHRPRRLLDRDGGSQHGANRLLIAVEQRFDRARRARARCRRAPDTSCPRRRTDSGPPTASRRRAWPRTRRSSATCRSPRRPRR